MKHLRLAAGIVAALVTIIGGAWAVEQHYATRHDLAEVARDYRQHVAEQQIIQTQERMWKVQDRLEKKPGDADAKKDLKELEFQKELLNKRLDKLKKEGS
jgi:hypothetical protein